MDDATIRGLARGLLDELASVVTDPVERAEVHEQLTRALTQPPGPAATRLIRRVLRRESVRPWLRRQRPALPDELKLPDGEENGRPARYLTGEVPDEVVVGQVFPLEVAVTRQARGASAPLRLFAVPPEGVDVRLVLRPGGLRVRSDLVGGTFVPPDEANRDSDTVLFELSAPAPGRYRPAVRAYVGGQAVGELVIEVVAGTAAGAGPAVSSAALDELGGYHDGLAVDIARDGDRYRYRVLTQDGVLQEEHHAEIPSGLMTLLHTELTQMATTRDYRGGGARLSLENLGLRLWNDAFPERVRAHLLDQLDAVRHVTVISDLHTVPWEALYPAGQSGKGMFLAERLPVVRQVSGQGGRYHRPLRLDPAAYVHPPRSPRVGPELDAVRDILGARVTHLPLITDLVGLADLLLRGEFGVLHLACHSEARRHGWDRVQLADGLFTPVFLEKARTGRTLRDAGPLVFFNACRTTGGAMDTHVESWAAAFLAAGSAAFVGSVWPVRTDTARAFAEAFYDELVRRRRPLGAASLAARAAVRHDEDPTWLAYAVYGAPDAAVTTT